MQTPNWRERFDELWTEHDDDSLSVETFLVYKDEFIKLIEKVEKESIERAIEVVENLHKDHSKCPLPQTCIGYQNAQEDITEALKTLLQ